MQHVRDPDILRILRACAVPSPSAACGSDRTVRAAAGTATAKEKPAFTKREDGL